MTTPSTIVFDLDGTLTESKASLTREMGSALAKLMARMPVAVMSGGNYSQFQKQLLTGMPADANFRNLYLFPTSAAQCYGWQAGEWQRIYNHPFTPKEKSRILAVLAEALHETGLDVPPPRLWGEQMEDREAQITWSALGQEAPVEEKKRWDPSRAKRLPAQVILIERLPGFSVRVNAATSIDITRAGMTKAYGVQKFSEIVGLPISSMLYVGDALFPGGNDAIVKETGIPTTQVEGPEETAEIISEILKTRSSVS